MTYPKPKRAKRVKPDPELVKLADNLLGNYKKPEDLIGENGLLKQLTKMLVERALKPRFRPQSKSITQRASRSGRTSEGQTEIFAVFDQPQPKFLRHDGMNKFG